MSILKNRDIKKEWGRIKDENYLEIVRQEIYKVAPQWVEERPLTINAGGQEINGST